MRILSKKAAAEKVGFHPEHMMKMAKRSPGYEDCGFPGPVRTGANSIGFIEAEVDSWIEARIKERDEHGYQPKPINPRANAARAAQRDEAA